MVTKIKEIFKYKGRTCVVLQMINKFIGNYCTGYVEIKRRVDYNKHISEFNSDELTFSGRLYPRVSDIRLKGKRFFGFDSGHAWNDDFPKSKTYRSVRYRTKKLCDEIVTKGY